MAHIRTMSTQKKDQEGKDRRVILKGLCSITVGVSFVPLTLNLLKDEHSLGSIDVLVREHAPAGGVFLRIHALKEPTDFRLWVRRVEDGFREIADQSRVLSSNAEVELTLDLPEARWVAGDYEMCVEAHQLGEDSRTWQSPWVHAFTLRHAMWQG